MEQIKLEKAKLIELERGKSYIITFDKSKVQQTDIIKIASWLDRRGIHGVFLGLFDPEDSSFEVIEIPDDQA